VPEEADSATMKKASGKKEKKLYIKLKFAKKLKN
jgi:hypothetical protein